MRSRLLRQDYVFLFVVLLSPHKIETLPINCYLDIEALIYLFFARPLSHKNLSSAPPNQAPVRASRHSSCVLIAMIHASVLVCVFICVYDMCD